MYPPPCIGQAEPLRRPWDLTGLRGRVAAGGKNAQADRQAGHWRGIGKGAALPPGPKPAAGYPCPRPAVGLAPAVAAARLLPGFAKAFARMAFSKVFQTWTTLYAPAINSLVSASPDC